MLVFFFIFGKLTILAIITFLKTIIALIINIYILFLLNAITTSECHGYGHCYVFKLTGSLFCFIFSFCWLDDILNLFYSLIIIFLSILVIVTLKLLYKVLRIMIIAIILNKWHSAVIAIFNCFHKNYTFTSIFIIALLYFLGLKM